MQILALAEPPHNLLIYHAHLKPGSHTAYDEIEQDIARDCAELGFPHPYLGIEPLSGPEEVWFLTAWGAEAELKQVADDYAKNAPLVAALERHRKRKASLILGPVEVFAKYRQDLSRGTPWSMGLGHFLVVTVTKGNHGIDGTVFESSDGTSFVMLPANTREEAEAKAAGVGSEARVFAVRPYWSMPAKEWVAADPEFWQPNRAAQAK